MNQPEPHEILDSIESLLLNKEILKEELTYLLNREVEVFDSFFNGMRTVSFEDILEKHYEDLIQVLN